MIFIISGPVNGGKTTALKKIQKSLRDRIKILSIISEKRYVKHGRNYWLYVNGKKYGKSVSICSDIKIFDETFEKISNTDLDKYELVIIDEIGPFELQGRCFYKLLNRVLKSNKKCVLSVRKGLVRKVVSFFKIKRFSVFKPSQTELLIKKLYSGGI